MGLLLKRDKVAKDNLNFFEHVSEKIQNSKRPIVIFPQATRVLPKERPPFKKGASRIYEELDILCQPVAINSGHVWPKKGVKKNWLTFHWHYYKNTIKITWVFY